MSVKTKDSIKAKWEKKAEQMRIQARYRYDILKQNRKKDWDRKWEYELMKLDRKREIYIKKKEEEYHRKMMNEIRELENKPPRVYKWAWPKINPIQFAMQLVQENARLRDTDEDGKGRCISCDTLCVFEGLAWWHRYSRKFRNICLEKENVNAQCHTCNKITWPFWNPTLKMKTNARYDENINKKWGEWKAEKLRRLATDFVQWRGKAYDLKKEMPRLIKENEKLWKEKSVEFLANHKPKRKWREIWEDYAKRH